MPPANLELLHLVADECEDSIVIGVCIDLISRSIDGKKKYNETLERNDLSPLEWKNHLYEELLDASNYLKKLMDQE